MLHFEGFLIHPVVLNSLKNRRNLSPKLLYVIPVSGVSQRKGHSFLSQNIVQTRDVFVLILHHHEGVEPYLNQKQQPLLDQLLHVLFFCHQLVEQYNFSPLVCQNLQRDVFELLIE